MDAEISQTINQLRVDIKNLREQVADLQYRADNAFTERAAFMIALSVTTGALDDEAMKRGKYLFSKIKETFMETSTDEDREKNLKRYLLQKHFSLRCLLG